MRVGGGNIIKRDWAMIYKVVGRGRDLRQPGKLKHKLSGSELSLSDEN